VTAATERPAAIPSGPLRILSNFDAVMIIVGHIIGSGIFKLPGMVASNSPSTLGFYGVWVLGGLVSFMGALCYAELASAYPNAGGDYYFLQRAFGLRLSFLFAWARLAVVTTAPIAILGLVFGEYLSNILSLGAHSAAIYAALAVIGFTGLNIIGIRQSKSTQNVLTLLEVVGLLAVIVTGILLVKGVSAGAESTAAAQAAAAAAPATPPRTWLGDAPLAMLAVLFAYGGWSDGAYISAELKQRGGIVRALMLSIGIVTVLYLLVNYAYMHTLGLSGVAASGTVASDVLRSVFGPPGAIFISVVVAICTLSSVNTTIIVGGRCNYALGRDWAIFRWLGHWDGVRDAPRNALLLQGAIALALIAGSALTGREFETLVNYTYPVFWFFVTLVGIGLFILRRKDPRRAGTFLVPWYPFTPAVFILTSAFLCYRAIEYASVGSLFGVGVLVVGVVVMLFSQGLERRHGADPAATRPLPRDGPR
jgi:APA family basic amino acid/polyamine antiporter